MIVLRLTETEASHLLTAVEIALEGAEEAKQEMMEDTSTLSRLDDFMEVMQDHQLMTSAIEVVRNKLVNELTPTAANPAGYFNDRDEEM